MLKKFGLMLGGLSLIATPVLANGQIGATPATAPVTGESQVEGEGVLAALLLVASIAVFVIIASDDDDPISA
jgi:hypothetical protein